jgi:8-oxo-dGTP diphosphatase
VSVFVVRHAKAGHRNSWDGDDRVRPLSKPGWAQADAIADRLAGEHVTALISSPYARCMQTLEPLAERVGLAVAADDRLAEGTTLEDVLALLAAAGDGAVLCSHGDVIPELIEGLHGRGMEISSRPDWRKATIWVLELAGGDAVARGRVEPPPI